MIHCLFKLINRYHTSTDLYGTLDVDLRRFLEEPGGDVQQFPRVWYGATPNHEHSRVCGREVREQVRHCCTCLCLTLYYRSLRWYFRELQRQ